MRIEKTRLGVERVRTVQGATFQGEQGISHIFYFSLLTKHPGEGGGGGGATSLLSWISLRTRREEEAPREGEKGEASF